MHRFGSARSDHDLVSLLIHHHTHSLHSSTICLLAFYPCIIDPLISLCPSTHALLTMVAVALFLDSEQVDHLLTKDLKADTR